VPKGVKVADVYAELNLDKDLLRQAMGGVGRELGSDADRLGRDLGDRMSRGLVGQVEQLSARLAKAKLQEQKATDAVALAQARLNEANEKGNVEGSRLLALQQRLSQAEAALAIAHDNTAKATTRHADAERRLAADVENLGKAIGPSADKAGRDTGDKLSQGIHLALVRNSPLIAAGIGAALAAGAPAVVAGAGLLFAGIGAVAAAQSEDVKAHWSSLWENVKSGTQDAAASLVPVFSRMADQLGASFNRLQPQLEQAFQAAGPLIDTLTGSLTRAAETAMPALVRSVQAAGPVFDGLGHAVEVIAQGLAGFFDNISAHSSAAGQAMAAIGDIVGRLLPPLGDLLGEGAELASVALPPLAAVLGVVGDALHAIAPILPSVAAGFGAFKLISALDGPLKSFSQTLAEMSYKNIPGLSSAAGTASNAVSGLGRALPAIGTGLALVGAVIVQSQQQIQEWAQALLDGGAAAQQAQAQMEGIESFFDSGFTGVGSATLGWTNWANALGVGSNASETAKQKAQELYDAMSPLQQAQQDVTTAQNNLSAAIDKYGQGSPQAVAAAAAYRAAQGEVAAQEAATEMAINGVTQAMLNQATQALANASSSFAYDQATQQVADAQARLAELQASGTATASDLNNATNSLNQALLAQVEAAGRLASDSLPATASETQKATAANSAMLQQLYQLKDTMGSAFPAALQNAINGLVASGATAGNYSAAAYNAMGDDEQLHRQLGHPRPAAPGADGGRQRPGVRPGAEHPQPDRIDPVQDGHGDRGAVGRRRAQWHRVGRPGRRGRRDRVAAEAQAHVRRRRGRRRRYGHLRRRPVLVVAGPHLAGQRRVRRPRGRAAGARAALRPGRDGGDQLRPAAGSHRHRLERVVGQGPGRRRGRCDDHRPRPHPPRRHLRLHRPRGDAPGRPGPRAGADQARQGASLMSWGALTIGGITFRETQSLTDDSGTVKIVGQEEHPPQTKAEVRSRLLSVLGLIGQTVPAVFEDKSVADGFYLVVDASSDHEDRQQAAYLTANWTMTLQRVGRERDVEFESRVPTIARSTELVGQTPSFWHAPPPDTWDYYTGSTVPSASVVRESAEGLVTVYRGIPANVAPRWTCRAAGYMDASPRILFDGIRLAGTETPALSVWQVDNGLVRVLGGGDATFSVAAWDPDVDDWTSVKSYVPTVGGAALTGTPELTILRNDPEEAAVRLSYPGAPGRATVDLGLRRGSRFVTGVFKRHAAATLGVARTAAEAATVVTGGLRATSADADGNRFLMGSSRTLTTTTGTASIAKAAVSQLDFFLGHEVGASPAAGDAFADLLGQYLGTSGDRTRVVRR
jgi:ABC-type transporter Mla subunit MlaD